MFHVHYRRENGIAHYLVLMSLVANVGFAVFLPYRLQSLQNYQDPLGFLFFMIIGIACFAVAEIPKLIY